MGRPRKPTNVLEFTGAFDKNPQRKAARANEPTPAAAAGDAGDWMTEQEKAAYVWVKERCAPGVLGNCDEGILELTAVLRAALVARTIDAKGRAQLRLCYTDLGMTPASRSKVQGKPSDPSKPANEFAAV